MEFNGQWVLGTCSFMRWRPPTRLLDVARITCGDYWNLSGILQLMFEVSLQTALSCLSNAPSGKKSPHQVSRHGSLDGFPSYLLPTRICSFEDRSRKLEAPSSSSRRFCRNWEVQSGFCCDISILVGRVHMLGVERRAGTWFGFPVNPDFQTRGRFCSWDFVYPSIKSGESNGQQVFEDLLLDEMELFLFDCWT